MIKKEGCCYICSSKVVLDKKDLTCSFCGYNHTKEMDEYLLTSVHDVNEMIKEGDDFIFLDIRTAAERKIAAIERTLHIPQDQLPKKLALLDKSREIIVFCHSGGRSFHSARFLTQKGFSAKSLDGGIDAWAEEIDATIDKY